MRHHRAVLTDAARLFVMETDIEKGKTLRHIVPQDFMQLVQLLIADQRTDLVQHNKFLSKYNRTQQFQHNALKNGQPLHRHVSRDVHAISSRNG